MSIQHTVHTRGGSSMGMARTRQIRWCADVDAQGRPLEYRLRDEYKSLTNWKPEQFKKKKKRKKTPNLKVVRMSIIG